MEIINGIRVLKRHWLLKEVYERYGRQWKSTKDCLFMIDKQDYYKSNTYRKYLLDLWYTSSPGQFSLVPWTRTHHVDKSFWREDICPDAKGAQKRAAYYKVTLEGLHFLAIAMGVEPKDEDAVELAACMLKRG